MQHEDVIGATYSFLLVQVMELGVRVGASMQMPSH